MRFGRLIILSIAQSYISLTVVRCSNCFTKSVDVNSIMRCLTNLLSNFHCSYNSYMVLLRGIISGLGIGSDQILSHMRDHQDAIVCPFDASMWLGSCRWKYKPLHGHVVLIWKTYLLFKLYGKFRYHWSFEESPLFLNHWIVFSSLLLRRTPCNNFAGANRSSVWLWMAKISRSEVSMAENPLYLHHC